MSDNMMQPNDASSKNLIIFIVEGESDKNAFKLAFQHLYYKIDERIEIVFLPLGTDVTTAAKPFRVLDHIESHLQNNRAIFNQLQEHREKAKIILLVDIDGVFIDNERVVINKKAVEELNKRLKEKVHNSRAYEDYTLKYEDDRIFCINRDVQKYIRRERNPYKRSIINVLIRRKNIPLSNDAIENADFENPELLVDFAFYYFSTNLEHFLPCNTRQFGLGKCDNAKKFATEFRNIEKFVKYFTEDKDSATNNNRSYEESWDHIKEKGTLNSLSRGTNIDLLIKNLYWEGSLANAVNIFKTGQVYNYEVGTVAGLCAIHEALFEGLSRNAGQINTDLHLIEKMPETSFEAITKKYIAMCKAQPFSIGNGPAIRIWYDLMLKRKLSKAIAWNKISKHKFPSAIDKVLGDTIQPLKKLLREALTNVSDDEDTIFENLKQSYCFEGFDPRAAIKFNC